MNSKLLGFNLNPIFLQQMLLILGAIKVDAPDFSAEIDDKYLDYKVEMVICESISKMWCLSILFPNKSERNMNKSCRHD